MKNFLSDFIAYCIIAVISSYEHFFFWVDDDTDPTQLDRLDEALEGNYVARWRYKINQMLGGEQSKEYYLETSANWQGCLAGCGCLTLIALITLLGVVIIILQ